MSSWVQRENQRLQEQVDDLKYEVSWLKELISPDLAFPESWALTGSEGKVMSALISMPVATKEAIYSALYSLGVDDEVEEKIIDVFICKVRAKVPHIKINTVWGQGYALDNRAAVIAEIKPVNEQAERVKALLDNVTRDTRRPYELIFSGEI